MVGAHGVTGKTFLTVLKQPEGYSDFPFLLALEPFLAPQRAEERPHLKVRVTLPLEHLRMELTQPEGEGSTSYLSQVLRMLALAMDRQGRIACAWTREYMIQLSRPGAGPPSPRQGVLEESLDIDPEQVHSLRVILITGLNDQISTRVQELKVEG